MRLRRNLLAAVMIAAACGAPEFASAASIVIDDFEGYATGDVGTVATPPWTGEVTMMATVVDEGNGNQYLTFGDNGGNDWRYLYRSTGLPLDATGSLNFRLYIEQETTLDHAFGLVGALDGPSVDWYADYGPYVRVTDDTAGTAGVVSLDARDGGAFVDDVATLNLNQWYDVRLDINTAGGDSGAGGANLFVDNALVFSSADFRMGFGAALDNFLLMAGQNAGQVVRIDNVTLTGLPDIVAVTWDVNGGGNWGDATNWDGDVAPVAGDDVLFGSVLTAENAPATVNLNVPASVNKLSFLNGSQYIVAGPNTLTLTGQAEISSGGAAHEISAVITGSAGLTKTGAGALRVSANNTYTGLTNVQAGALQIVAENNISGNVSVAANASLQFWGDNMGGGYNGGFGGTISGDGGVVLEDGAAVTFSNAKGYNGATTLWNDSVLTLSGSGSPGAMPGTAAGGTNVNEQARVALTGGIAIGTEFLSIDARQGDDADLVHLTSSGNNSWGGNIKGDVGGTQYNIESTTGTLTLGGTISAPDTGTGARNFVFGGAGNFNVTGRITDVGTDADGNMPGGPLSNNNTVSVYKRGAGTLTIRTGTDQQNDFWLGSTVVEEGTLEVISDGSDNGELWSSSIAVRAGAVLDIDHFGTYALQPDQGIGGGGTVRATGKTVEIYSDNDVTPGDSVGTLRIEGNVALNSLGAGGVWNYELGDTTTVGGTENDLLQVTGSLTGTLGSEASVNVTPVEGDLATGGVYRLASAASGTPTVSGVTARIVGPTGTVLTTRQTVALSSAAGQINLTVTGSEASLTWNGSSGQAWNVNSTPNWTGGPTFYDLDDVTFNDSAGANDTVDISTTNVSPGSVTFNSATGNTYTVTGTNGIATNGPVSLTGNVTVALQNSGNNLAGGVSLASGTTLAAGDGTTLGNVTAANGSTLRIGGAGLQQVLAGTNFTYVDADDATNTTLADGSAMNPVQPGSAAPGVWVDRGVAGAQDPLGNGGSIYQAGPDASTSAPALRTRITGLTPNTAYMVHVNYWDATGSDWRIQAGDSSTSLTLFDSIADAVPGATDGIDAATVSYGGTAPLAAEGNRTMFGGNLGIMMTDGSGNLDVYVDDAFTTGNDPRTWYDGISYTSSIAPVPGVVTGAETLTIDGDLNLAATSTLAFDIGQSGYSDFLSIGGNLAANGTLQVLLDNDAAALTAGDSYDLFDFGSVSGTFATLTLPTLAGSLAWDTSQLLVDGTISVMSNLGGDFDGDGDVDGRDFLAWQRTDGTPAGLTAWKANYGATSAVSANVAVPEPASLVLVGGAMLAAVATGGRRRLAAL